MNENVSNYNLEYKGVKCTGVIWDEKCNVFHFDYMGQHWVFAQERYVSASADTDHIRIVIDEQFLPRFTDFAEVRLRKEVAKEVLQEYTQQLIDEFKESGDNQCNTTVARVLKDICPQKVDKIFRRYAKQHGIELDGNND